MDIWQTTYTKLTQSMTLSRLVLSQMSELALKNAVEVALRSLRDIYVK